MVNNARIKRASIDSSWLRLIDVVPTVVEVAEASNSRTLPSVHFSRQHNIVRGSSLPDLVGGMKIVMEACCQMKPTGLEMMKMGDASRDVIKDA
ncbi:hypothetical protein Tco_0110209 [Tanacetum coccineum]